jgi:hypothetical protein
LPSYKTIIIDDDVWPHFNRASFDQDKLVSLCDYQYGLYWSADKTLTLFRRDLRDDSVQRLRFPDYVLTINPKDGHRNTVVGISPADGRLHMSWDHHNNDLRYTKSRAGFLTSPPDEISLTDFEPQQPLTEGAPQRVTYPRFFNDSDDNLFFIYRTGSSGSGDSVLSRYDAQAGTWHLIATCLFSKEGVYPPWEDSDSRNAYLHDVLFDREGNLHITWVYREAGKSWASNHDLHYAWSSDSGLTWRNNEGLQIADVSNGDPIALDDPGIAVWNIPVYSWLMNQCAMTIDSRNRIHVATFHMPEPFVPDTLEHNPPDAVVDRLRVYHYWRDGSGTWHSSGPLEDAGRTLEHGRQRRPNIVGGENNHVSIYEATSVGYRSHTASETDAYTEWTSAAMTGTEFAGSDAGKHDRRLLRDRGILSFTGEQTGTEGRTIFAVLDFDQLSS